MDGAREGMRLRLLRSPLPRLPARLTTNTSFPRIPAGTVTVIASDKACKLIAPGRLTFDESSVVHRVASLLGL